MMFRDLINPSVSVAVLLGLSACSRNAGPEPASRDQPTSASSATPAPTPTPVVPSAAAPPSGQKLVWEVPKAWQEDPRPRAMRKATYNVPAAKGDDRGGELAVFYFGPDQGGGIEPNIERWASQFGKTSKDTKRTLRKAHGLQQHLVEIDDGTYKPDMAGTVKEPTPGWGMLAGIVESPEGPYFFKLVGPKKTVASARADFEKLLDSARIGS